MQAIVEGCRVRVDGLKKRADVNGKEGTALAPAGERWVVEVEGGEQLQILQKNITVVAPPAAAAAAEGGEDDDDDDAAEEAEESPEEDEEGEEAEESDEDDDESEHDRTHVVNLKRASTKERLGLDFVSADDLTLEGVTPGTAAGRHPEVAAYIGWKLAAINGVAVATLPDAAPLIQNETKLALSFFKRGVTYTEIPACDADANDPITFHIPLDAPLNPNAKIEIGPHPSSGRLRYKVNGKARAPFEGVIFSIMGDNFTRELRFPSLGTCMWIPAEQFDEVYPALRNMLSAHGVETRGFASRFRNDVLEEVRELEDAAAEERAAKEARKTLPKNAKKRKVVRRAIKDSAAKKRKIG